MAIQFGNDTSKIEFVPAASHNNITLLSVMAWITFDGFHAAGFSNHIIRKMDDTGNWGWNFRYFGNAVDHVLRIDCDEGFYNALPVLNTGTRYLLGFSYDRSLTTNVPAMYVNGVAQSVSAPGAPIGALADDSSYNIKLSSGTATTSLYGTMNSILICDRFLSPAGHAQAYASRKAFPTYRGLVFAPILFGVAGGAKDGDTMGAGNNILDKMSGAIGTPSGSPIFRAENYLGVGG